DDVDEGVLQGAGLHLVFEDAKRAEHGQAGVLEGGELAGEEHQGLGPDAADDERLLGLLVPALLLLLSLPRADGRELGDEVAHLLELLLGLLLVGGLDLVLDLFTGRVHRLEFVGRHVRCLRAVGGGPAAGRERSTLVTHGRTAAAGGHVSSSITVSRTTSSMVVAPAKRASRPRSRRPLTPFDRASFRRLSLP